jgi:hypothetical protein
VRAIGTTLAAALAALQLAACGGISKPAAGRGVIDDQRTGPGGHLQCMQAAKLPAVKIGATQIRVGQAPDGPLIDYQPTAGNAQGVQITGQVQGAEAIGSALLYPNRGSDHDLTIIEKCLDKGVKG